MKKRGATDRLHWLKIKDRNAKIMAFAASGLSYGKITAEIVDEYPTTTKGMVAAVVLRNKKGDYTGPREVSAKSLRVIELLKTGLTGSQVAHALRKEFPSLTLGQVNGTRLRARERGDLQDAVNIPRAPRRKERTERKAPVYIFQPAHAVADTTEGRERRRQEFERMTNSHGCKFPVGDPRSPEFHFCCQPRGHDGPYCDEHHELTHQTIFAYAQAAE